MSGPGHASNVPESPLERIGAICRAFGIASLLPQLAAGEEIAAEGGVVDVAVLGQFKAGKSSFLNSLIGRDVMPVDVLPATSVVTRIGYGPSDRAVVRFLSGESREVAIDRLAEYVTERGNPGNGRQVSLVEVELASLAGYRGIRFVDTPGLGSAHEHNTRASLEWLPRVGGALVAVSVSHPMSEQDLRLLGEVARHTPEMAVLLTKADLVSESQLDSVVEFTKRQAAHRTGRELPILPCSVNRSFEALRARVRAYLDDRIVARREDAFAEIVEHKRRALSAGCRSYLRMALAAAEAAEDARGALVERLRRERGDMGCVRGELGGFTRDLKSRVRTAAGERFHSRHGEVAARLEEGLRTMFGRWSGNLARTAGEFREWLARALEEELAVISAQSGGSLSGFLENARKSVHRTVRAFQDRLAEEIRQALGVAFDGARFESGIREPERPDVRVGRTFDTNVDLLWFLIPMSIVRPVVSRHFLRLIPWEAEKNLSRLAAQWADALDASIDDLARQAIDFMENELTTIEGLVSGCADRREEIRKALSDLDVLEGTARP